MRRLKKIAMAAAGPAVLIASLTGCSEETKAVPALPERICWDAFDSKDVSPLLPAGEKATFSAFSKRPFSLPQDSDMASCSLDIDGVTKFQAIASREGFEEGIDWSPWDKADPDPIDVGERGIVWYNGAASYIVCEPSKDPSTPGRYVELRLTTYRSADEEKKARTVLPALLKEFVAFAERELKCS